MVLGLIIEMPSNPDAFQKFTGFATHIVPKGHAENSPAFQRWVQGHTGPRPERTAELLPRILPVSRPFGTHATNDGIPALKRRAIFNHPSGMMRAARLRNAFVNFHRASGLTHNHGNPRIC